MLCPPPIGAKLRRKPWSLSLWHAWTRNFMDVCLISNRFVGLKHVRKNKQICAWSRKLKIIHILFIKSDQVSHQSSCLKSFDAPLTPLPQELSRYNFPSQADLWISLKRQIYNTSQSNLKQVFWMSSGQQVWWRWNAGSRSSDGGKVYTSGPQTTVRGPNPARLHIWTGPLNNTRDAFRFIIFFTRPAAVEIAVRRGENVKWCSSQ